MCWIGCWFLCIVFLFEFIFVGVEKIVNYIIYCSIYEFEGVFGKGRCYVIFCLLGESKFGCSECG